MVTHEDFVRECLLEQNAKSLAESLGVTSATVYRRHLLLVDAGVDLPPLVRGGTIDVRGLNQIITQHENENGQSEGIYQSPPVDDEELHSTL